VQIYNGTGIAHTETHDLGITPEMIIVKNDDFVVNWKVYHRYMNGGSSPWDYGLDFNDDAAKANDDTLWNDTSPTSSVFTVGTHDGVNKDGDSHVAYLFTSIEGYSKIFKYTGNLNVDGPFIYCGFKPKFVLIKNDTVQGSWVVQDGARNTYNPMDQWIKVQESNAEFSGMHIDWLSNGFKIRIDDAETNGNTENHIGIAFAETPFQYANSR